MPTVTIIGAGIFGVTAALELRRRGWEVRLLDPGPLPHPLAASTDTSKVVRLEYGADDQYTEWMETALEGWRAWNRAWGETLFHETGMLLLRRGPLAPGTYEGDSLAMLQRRGHSIETLDSDEIARRFPAWAGAGFEGSFNPVGGYAESSRVVERLLVDAVRAGVTILQQTEVCEITELASSVRVSAADGTAYDSDAVVISAGAWTPYILPELRPLFHTAGMPVFHLRPAGPGLFAPGVFPVFTADVSRTGYYGFPIGRQGTVKIANHGTGRPMTPDSPEREVTDEETAHLRAFLREHCPSLVDAPIAFTRVCLYCDTADGDFWISRHPERPRWVVAAGGSGHAFKFAPLIGSWIADAVEGRETAAAKRFRWRADAPAGRADAARGGNE